MFGNATIKVPPKPTSQTSCHDHNGPMAAMTRRRSASVLPTMCCNIPAPMSNPSSTMNITSMKVKIAYQISIMGHLQFAGCRKALWTVCDFARDQKQKQHAQHEIKSGETDEREQNIAAAHDIADALAGVQNVKNNPRLPSQFRRHPTRRRGDVRKRKRQHQCPQQNTRFFQPTAPSLEIGNAHQQDEQRSQTGHDVK